MQPVSDQSRGPSHPRDDIDLPSVLIAIQVARAIGLVVFGKVPDEVRLGKKEGASEGDEKKRLDRLQTLLSGTSCDREQRQRSIYHRKCVPCVYISII